MLEYFFTQRYRILQLRRGPLAEHLDGLARELRLKGYRPWTGRQILSVAGRLNIFARTQGITCASQVDDAFAERFLREELALEGDYRYAPNALMHLTDYLQRTGVIPMPSDDRLEDPDDALLSRFDNHLRDVRGLMKFTRQHCLRGARVFLRWFREQHPPRTLNELRGNDVLNFVIEVFGWRPTWSTRAFRLIKSLTYLGMPA